jgi:hypothetical protein
VARTTNGSKSGSRLAMFNVKSAGNEGISAIKNAPSVPKSSLAIVPTPGSEAIENSSVGILSQFRILPLSDWVRGSVAPILAK